MPLDATLQATLDAIVGAADPDLSGQLVVIADLDRTFVSTGAVSTFRAATGEWATGTSDSPANTPYVARLRMPQFSQSVLESDWQRAGGALVTELALINNDGVLDADFDRSVYAWRGAAVRLRAGLQNWLLTQFKPLPAGDVRVIDVLPDEEQVRVLVQTEAERLDGPIQGRPAHPQGRYGGFEHAYDFAGTANVTAGDTCNIGLRSATIHCRFRVAANPAAAAVLVAKRDSVSTTAGTTGWVVFLNTSGLLRVVLDDGTNAVAYSIGTNGQFVDDVWHGLDVVVDRLGDTIAGYVDGVEISAAASISTVTGSLSNTQPLRHGRLSTTASNFWTGRLDEVRIWQTALTKDQAASRWRLAADGVEPGLIGYWPYDENTGTTIRSLVRGPMFVQPVLSAGPTCSMGTAAGNPGSGSFTLVCWGRLPAAASGVFAGRKSAAAAANAGYTIVGTGASGQVDCRVSDGTTQVTAVAGTGLDDDTEYGFALVVDRTANELRAYRLDHRRGTLTLAATTSISGLGSFGPAGVNFKVGSYDGGASLLTGSPSWVGYTPVALSATAIRLALSEQWVEHDDELATAPPTLINVAAGSHWWPLDETSGTTANDRIASGGVNGTWSSAPTRRTKDATLTAGASGVWVGTLEGGRDLRGLSKPVALGRPQRLAPVLIDSARRIYQYSDPSLGATQSVDKVWDAGELLTLTTHYTVNLTDSTITVQVARTIVGDITLSCHGIKNVGGTAWLRFPGELVQAVWERLLGLTGAVATASVTAYDDLHPYTQGLWLGPCDATLECLYDRLLAPDGYAYRDLAGKMALGTRTLPVTGTTPALVLDASSIISAEAVDAPPPTWLARVSYDRTITKISSVATGSSLEDRKDATQGAAYVEDRRLSVAENHPDAIERTYDTALTKRQDAALLVQRMLDFDGAERRAWRVGLDYHHWAVDLGEVVEVDSYSRYDLAGKLYAVVGYEYGLNDGMPVSALVLWGGVTA